MLITVRLYGAPRVALRLRERELELAEGATAADAVATLVEELGPVARTYLLDAHGRGYAVALSVNGAQVAPTTELRAGDILTLMPPTAGG